ncbi:MAG: hypothetical protein K9M57_00420 [Phycisphaerae bacterium]|nr:hypothetical protein [Phycisphaerae bacterium]
MNNKTKLTILCTGVMFSMALSTGCSSKKMVMEGYFDAIEVNKNNSTDVLNMLPEKGMLRTSNSVSVLEKKGANREVGIVVFKENDDQVLRTDYLQKKQNLTHVRLYSVIKTEVSDKVLNQPFENNMRKHVAILRYCWENLVTDAKPFLEDQETESLMGLARTALSTGIIHLTSRPREAEELMSTKGFKFEHPTLKNCWMWLEQDTENTYTVTIRSKSIIDPFMKW